MERTSTITAIWNFLSSKTLNIFLLVAGSVYGIMLSAWGAASPNVAVVRIADSLPMKLWLAFLIINTLFCMIRYFPIAVKATTFEKAKPTVESFKKKRNHLVVNTAMPADKIVPKLAPRFRTKGYRTKLSRDALALRATRSRLSPLGTLFFHSAFFLVILGIAISPMVRTESQVIVATGDTFSTEQKERLMQINPPNTEARLPEFGFKVEKIQPRFWKDELLFTDMRAKIRPLGSTADALVLLSSAYKPGPATYVTLVGIGYAPYYRLVDDSGNEIESGYVNLATFPPGSEDSFALSSLPYNIFVKVMPDYRIRKGKIVNKSNNLKRLGYLIRVVQNEQTIEAKLLKPKESLDVGRLHLSFPKMVYWGQFKIIHNPGLLLIWLGFIAGLASLVWRLIFYRQDFTVLAVPKKAGTEVHMHVRSDYFSNQALADLRTLGREIESWTSGTAAEGSRQIDAS